MRLFFRAGCYLSKASYVRPSEPAIDKSYPSFHLVTYYRAMRFYSDGRCYLVTSPEEPATLVKQLATARLMSRRIPGLLKGRYQLINDRLTAVLHRATSPSTMFYVHLQVECCKRSGLPHGALRWMHYEYRSVSDAAATPLPLEPRQFPILQFSRVRSYLRASKAPLRVARSAPNRQRVSGTEDTEDQL